MLARSELSVRVDIQCSDLIFDLELRGRLGRPWYGGWSAAAPAQRPHTLTEDEVARAVALGCEDAGEVGLLRGG